MTPLPQTVTEVRQTVEQAIANQQVKLDYLKAREMDQARDEGYLAALQWTRQIITGDRS
jgi:hypothetical protein